MCIFFVPKEGCRVLEFRNDNEGRPYMEWSMGLRLGSM